MPLANHALKLRSAASLPWRIKAACGGACSLTLIR